MPFPETLLSPFHLLFFIIIVGLAFGKIHIKGISLGIAGILFSGIFVGFLISLLSSKVNAEIATDAQRTMQAFSSLGSSLFVSVIGLQAGSSIKSNCKGSLLAFAIGAMMSISGVIMTLLISVLDQTIGYPTVLGVLCGALTSTPGLSSVCELIGANSEEAVLGYGCSYLFGVIFAVFFTQLCSKKTMKSELENAPNFNGTGKTHSEFILLSITAFLGTIFGGINIPFFNASLGNTASTLLIGLMIGYIIQTKFASVHTSRPILNAFKTLGLALFFVGTGFATGIKTVAFDIKLVFYGALITLTAILCGWAMCKMVLPGHRLQTEFIIAGGMTSSPAYGTISANASDSSVNHFSAAYFGGIISMILAIQIVVR